MADATKDDLSAVDRIRHPQKRAFLAAIATIPDVQEAAALADVARSSHYLWKKTDPDYAEAFEVAWSLGIDAMEAEAVRRAYHGVKKPVFRNGKRALDFVLDADGNPKLDKDGKPIAVPAVIVEKSDTLLMFVLNGHRSQTYRQRTDNRFVDSGGNDVLTLDMIRNGLAGRTTPHPQLAPPAQNINT